MLGDAVNDIAFGKYADHRAVLDHRQSADAVLGEPDHHFTNAFALARGEHSVPRTPHNCSYCHRALLYRFHLPSL